MWRRLLRIVHPDIHGDVGLFIWCPALHEHVAGAKTLFSWDWLVLCELVGD
jgi:hypothetical protein